MWIYQFTLLIYCSAIYYLEMSGETLNVVP